MPRSRTVALVLSYAGIALVLVGALLAKDEPRKGLLVIGVAVALVIASAFLRRPADDPTDG